MLDTFIVNNLLISGNGIFGIYVALMIFKTLGLRLIIAANRMTMKCQNLTSILEINGMMKCFSLASSKINNGHCDIYCDISPASSQH